MAKIDVNLNGAGDACNYIKVSNDLIDNMVSELGSFSTLYLCDSLISEIKNSLNEMKDVGTKVSNAITAYIKPEEGNGGNGGNGNGGGTGGSSIVTGGSLSYSVDRGQTINPSDFGNLTVTQTSSLLTGLKDLADKYGVGVNELLENEAVADELKEYLLECEWLPDEVRELLLNADSQVVRRTLESLLKGECPEMFGLNPTNLGGIYSYLTLVAQNNNISVEDLLNDPKNSEILKGALSDYEEVGKLLLSIDDLSPENYQKQLNDMYNGTLYEGQNKVMTASSVDIIKSYVDHISQESGIKVEDLLTNTDYASALKEGTQEFAKASSFMGVQATNCGKDGNPVVSNLFNGKNQAALGMTSDEVNSFKAEVDALASSNGVDSNTLLTDSKYADSVSELVNKSGNTVGIGSMFGKCESSKMQNVANNIYNTEYVTTETRSVEQEEFASSVELEG